MPGTLPRAAAVLVVLAALLPAGCWTRKPAAPVNPSPLFVTGSALDPVVRRAAQSEGCVPAHAAAWSSGGSTMTTANHRTGLRCNIRGTSEVAGKILLALQAQFDALIQQTGTQVVSRTEEKDADGRLAAFTIGYQNGDARGTIEAKRIPPAQRPDNPDPEAHEIRTEIVERVGASGQP